MRLAACHSERKYFAKGFCKPCYQREYQREYYRRNPKKRHRTPEQKALYNANALAKRRSDPDYQARQRQWRRENRPWMRAHHVAKHYGLTLEQDLALGNTCFICRIECDPRGRVKGGRCIDHDHARNRVRGILCRECNLGISNFKDDPELLARASKYLRQCR